MRIFRLCSGSAGVAFCLLLLLGAAVSSADVVHLIASETPYAGSVSSHPDGGFTVAWKSGNFGDIDVSSISNVSMPEALLPRRDS